MNYFRGEKLAAGAAVTPGRIQATQRGFASYHGEGFGRLAYLEGKRDEGHSNPVCGACRHLQPRRDGRGRIGEYDVDHGWGGARCRRLARLQRLLTDPEIGQTQHGLRRSAGTLRRQTVALL